MFNVRDTNRYTHTRARARVALYIRSKIWVEKNKLKQIFRRIRQQKIVYVSHLDFVFSFRLV